MAQSETILPSRCHVSPTTVAREPATVTATDESSELASMVVNDGAHSLSM